MNPLIQDILRRHLSLPAEEQPIPEQRQEEGSSNTGEAHRSKGKAAKDQTPFF